jgi:hypothetical protein
VEFRRRRRIVLVDGGGEAVEFMAVENGDIYYSPGTELCYYSMRRFMSPDAFPRCLSGFSQRFS